MAAIPPRFLHPFLLLLACLLLKLFSLNSGWVERFYSTGIYPVTARLQRLLLGWLPISLGDVLYVAAGAWLLYKTLGFIRRLLKRSVTRSSAGASALKLATALLSVYLFFTLFWGLNYYRQGIAPQLGMEVKPYDSTDLARLLTVLLQRVNASASTSDSTNRLQYNKNRVLFDSSVAAYTVIAEKHSFLTYRSPSVKPSLFTPIGHWFGFTGYYNPFTAEAQLKTTVPVFLKPFIITHEVAHQIGYAKENEANFVAFLTCKASGNAEFVYSAYFEMFRDAFYNYRVRIGKPAADSMVKLLAPRLKQDSRTLREYLLHEKNPIEPFMSGAYDKYLKLHNQPAGKATYNEVVAYLVAYMKKFGADAL